ncbi:N-acetyltransferase [Nonomuraea turkmeniaca]|uniref:N-acetyltransferase n=1 Tax=Nonomuraea turkmeniaca TaxID=103838 RepID=A0A5S4FG09_9ACTN|nr:N-acetyltransferase [Nonomuraea turkmeniaca]TMR18289.1 N-acetyltransferase [Nonomuraea turkmeniaca]
MSDRVIVEPVVTRRDRERFLDLPYRLHAGEPHWVPPLRREAGRLISPRHNPFFAYGTARLFVARRGPQVLGRIAAVHNPRHNSRFEAADGFFGQFECADDGAAARALIDAAGHWLRGRRLTSMIGPVNLTTNGECGVLVDGFDTPPRLLMPYNPPYYGPLLEAAGLRKAKDLWAWRRGMRPFDERFSRVAARLEHRARVRVRPIDLRDFDDELARIRHLYNSAFDGLWGFVPMTEGEFGALARQLRPILDPGLVLIAESGGEPVGVSISLPDLNQALPAARGRLTTWGLPLGLLRLRRAARSIDAMRSIVVGVLPEHRGRGVEILLYAGTLRAAVSGGYRDIELGWTLEDNSAIVASLRAAGCTPAKTYRLYRGDLP